MPPSEAPMTIGLTPDTAREFGGDGFDVGGIVGEGIGAVREPLGIAMTALIERISGVPLTREFLGRLGPGVAGLAAAVQQQHRRPPSPNTSAASLLPAAPMKVAVAGVRWRVMACRSSVPPRCSSDTGEAQIGR